MEILVGREAGVENPRLSLSSGSKQIFLGTPGSVNKKVSRKHCKLEVKEDGTILSITDITENNFMYVNGREYKSKRDLTVNDTVELGPEHYKLDLQAILKAFIGSPTYHIAHLKTIWEDYQKATMDMQIRQNKLSTMSSFPMIISMLGGVIVGIIPGIDPNLRNVLIGVAVVLMVVFFIKRLKSAETNPLKRKELDDKFHRDYVCPNPNCRHFFGSMRYDELLNNKVCPWCKSKLVK